MAKTLKEYLDWQAAQLKSASEFLKWDKGHEFLKWQKRWTGEKWQKRWTGEDAAPPTQSEPAPPAPVPTEPPTKAVTRPKPEPSPRPGDRENQWRARRFLYRVMVKYPMGLAGKTKDDFKLVCMKRFKIADRRFRSIWDDCIADTGATSYSRTGPKGPHEPRQK